MTYIFIIVSLKHENVYGGNVPLQTISPLQARGESISFYRFVFFHVVFVTRGWRDSERDQQRSDISKNRSSAIVVYTVVITCLDLSSLRRAGRRSGGPRGD